MFVSCIIPMYDEEENARLVVKKTDDVMKQYDDYEIICVNDGSKDGTLLKLNELKKDFPALKVVTYEDNIGMGYAIRKGIEAAKGDVIITLDADQTFDPEDIPKLMDHINEYDIVIGSPYIKGGKLENVAFYRAWISKLGNIVLSSTMPYDVQSTTTVFRAYRREVFETIDIESDKMEINPEILTKAGALGYKVKEVPVKLSKREFGESKFSFFSGVRGHFWLSAYEKPFIIFGFFGILLLIFGLISGLYILKLYLSNSLDPNRPLINLTILFTVGGMIILLFGFVSNQILQIKKEILKIRRDMVKKRRI